MSLNSIMNIATQGLMAGQAGIRTTTQNVSNVNTPGYVRLEHNQSGRSVAGQGAGVEIAAVHRAANRFLEAASRAAGGASGQMAAKAQYLDQIQAAFGDPTSSGSLFARLDATLGAFEAAVANPGSLTARRAALADLSGLLSRISQIGTEIQAARDDANARVGTTVDRINSVLTDIASANGEIARAQVQGDASGAQQRQSDLLNELSGLVDVRSSLRPDGTTEVRLTDGTLLVGYEAARLSFDSSGAATGAYPRVTIAFGTDPTQRALEPDLQGGALRGLIDVRDRDLSDVAEAVGELAGKLADALNAEHNQNASLPPLPVAQGRDTGLLAGDALGFTGRTTIAVLGPAGTLARRIEVDFTAGTVTVDGVAAGGTGGTIGAFTANLNAALGGFGSASFVNGALRVDAAQVPPGAAGNGLVFDQPEASALVQPSARGGKGFAHFFGLNDLVRSGLPASHTTGLVSADAHGFPPGAQLGFRLLDATGGVTMERTVALPPGGTIADTLAALNNPVTGFGALGQFTLDANGQMRWQAAAGQSGLRLQMTEDTGPRGGTGRSFGALFGLSQSAREDRATSLSIDPAIAADPRMLGFARPDLTGIALGQVAVGLADSRGAQALFDVSRVRMDFEGPTAMAARSMTLADFASSVAGDVGSRAARAETDKLSAEALKTEADTRRSNVEGVNLDEELVKLTSYQQAYSAAARMIRAADEMYQALLNAV